MNRHFFTRLAFFAGLAALSAVLSGAEKRSFPELKDIGGELLLKPRPTLSIDRDGNWIVNGKMRYLLGAQSGSLFGRGAYQKIPGGDPRWSWISERAPNYESCQRAGLDTLCLENPMTYMKELFPAFKYDLLKPSCDGFALEPGLPVLMDYTCAPWNNGRAANRKGEDFYHPEIDGSLPADAIVPRGGNVWVPYSIFHPEGRKVYKAMWESGAKIIKKYNVPVLAYELFNEPMYSDMGPYARKCFASELAKKYGTVQKMNTVWKSSFKSFEEASKSNLYGSVGSFVDYIKFLEDGMVDICRFGENAIRAIDPSARFCIQLKGLWHYRRITGSAMNLYKLNKLMQVVTVSTSGGIGRFEGAKAATPKAVDSPANPIALSDSIMQRHFYRALADGKPMQNQEMYVGKDYMEILSKLWLDYCRGSAATYIFAWNSGIVQWRPRTVEGGKRSAEIAPYTMLNPYAVPPENLPAIFQAKEEIFRYGKDFLPRDRKVKREIAVLYSYPTERASGSTGYTLKSEFAVYGGALEYAHFPIDVLFEEQFPENRQNRYRAIVAAGVRNTYAGTVPSLMKFVKNGGVLILGREFMPEGEYADPVKGWENVFDGMKFTDDFDANPAKTLPSIPQLDNLGGKLTVRTTRRITAHPGWEVLVKDGKNPVLLRKKIGKGSLYLLTAEMPDYSLASMLGSVMKCHGIRQEAVLRRYDEKDLPVNVELHTTRVNGRTTHLFYNYDGFAKLVTFESDDLKKHQYMVDLTEKKILPVKNGRATILLPPQVRVLVGIGPEKAFAEFGKFTPVQEKEIISCARKLQTEHEAKLASARAASFQFTPDPAQTHTLNLRAIANSAFADRTVPGDGKGGWTDQGRASSLNGVPWGTQSFLGVPCEIIRFDENDDKTCIVLKSVSSKIPFPESATVSVNENLRALYFFHTAAWVPQTKVKAMDYEIRYASGKITKIPVITNENIWDWYAIRNKIPLSHCAWKNRESHGFFCFEWVNPTPQDPVVSVTMRSANGKVIPIVIAISAEKYAPAAFTSIPTGWKVYSYGGLRPVEEKNLYGTRAGGMEKLYAGFVVSCRGNLFPVTEELLAKGVLKLDIRGGLDKFGARKNNQQFMISIAKSGAYGKNLFRGKRVWIHNYLPGKQIGTEFKSLVIPLKDILTEPGKVPKDGCNQLSFRAEGPIPDSGIEIRNIRVELSR